MVGFVLTFAAEGCPAAHTAAAPAHDAADNPLCATGASFSVCIALVLALGTCRVLRSIGAYEVVTDIVIGRFLFLFFVAI